MKRLKKRAEFVAAAKGARTERRAFVIQGLRRDEAEGALREPDARFGFTVTKKTGNSVERSRIKRRLRAAASACAADARPGCDYVLVARRAAISLPFADLVSELAGGLARLDRALKPPLAAKDDKPPSGTSR